MPDRRRHPADPAAPGPAFLRNSEAFMTTPVDTVRRSPVAADHAARAKRRILVATSLVTSLIMLDSNIVAVSLPSIARALGAAFADIEWVTRAYLLTFTALLLSAGSYADRHGRKRTTLIGLVVFAVASGLCGLAQTALMLDLARALQGV